jgi:hypothetical protein
MARNFDGLPQHFPVGTKYVVESRGSLVHRYVEFPDGRKISLPTRKAIPCCPQGNILRDVRSEREGRLQLNPLLSISPKPTSFAIALPTPK